jgi:hypothetical protein
MRVGLFLIGAMLLLAPTAQAQQDTIGTRLAAAERYVDAADLGSLIEGILDQSIQQLPPEKQREAKASQQKILANIDMTKLRNIMVNAMVQTMNTDELTALANFYNTSTGKSILRKLPALEAAMKPAMAQEIANGVQRAQQK